VIAAFAFVVLPLVADNTTPLTQYDQIRFCVPVWRAEVKPLFCSRHLAAENASVPYKSVM
jgi:hypothetical protein